MGVRADSAAATRDRIIAAAGEMFLTEAVEDVTLARIAKAAGVSHQTVLNHFENKDGVIRAVAEVLGAETIEIRSASTPGDVPAAVHALVDDYERMGDANFRWASSADRSEGLAEVLAGARVGHQSWITTMFGDSLPKRGRARTRAIAALHAATDVYTWKLLRRDLGLDRNETEKTIVELVLGIIEGKSR